jgi:hypothetical protein
LRNTAAAETDKEKNGGQGQTEPRQRRQDGRRPGPKGRGPARAEHIELHIDDIDSARAGAGGSGYDGNQTR